MTKRKGDFRSKIDSILADDPKPASAGGSRKGRDRRFGTDAVRRSGRDALARHLAPTTETKLDEIDLKKIKLPRGRRTDADPELNDSIGRSGILQPLLLRPIGSGYEVLDGGRRLAVARELGLQAVPAVVRTIADTEARAMSAERRAVATVPPRRGRPPAAVRAPAAASTRKPRAAATAPVPVAGSTRRARATAAVPTSAAAGSTRKARATAPVPTSAAAGSTRKAAATAPVPTGSTRKARVTAPVATSAAASTRNGRAAAPVPAPAVASTRTARAAAPVATSAAASTRNGRAAAAVPVSVAVSSPKARAATPALTPRAGAAKHPAANSSAKKRPITRLGSTKTAIARGAVEAPKVVAAPEVTVAAPARKYRRAPARPEPVAPAAGAPVPSVPVEVPPAAEPQVAFGPADEAVEMRPSIAETAAADSTIIWQRPGETEREDSPEDEADEKPVPPRAVAASAAAATTSFARPDELFPALPVAAAPARPATALATERPAGGRNVLGTAFFLLALFAAAFAVTSWVAYNDVGLAVQAGLVGVIALVLFSAVTLTGRRTGP